MNRSAPLLLAALLLAGSLPAAAEESGSKTKSLKEIGKDILEDTKAAGRAIRDSEVGKESQQAWRHVRKASVRAAKDVRDATVDFWNAKIVGKEQERDRLKKENARLREEAR